MILKHRMLILRVVLVTITFVLIGVVLWLSRNMEIAGL